MRLIIALLLAVIFYANACPALTEAEYLRLLQESALFRKENTDLTDQWLRMKKAVNKEQWPILVKEQQEWLANGRDKEAEANMKAGYSREYAYAKATHDRAALLWSIEENISLSPEEKARGEGVGPEAYDAPAGSLYGAYDGKSMGKIDKIIPTAGDLSQVHVIDSFGKNHIYYISRREIAEKVKRFQQTSDARGIDCNNPEPREGELYIFEELRTEPASRYVEELGEKEKIIRLITNFSQCYG